MRRSSEYAGRLEKWAAERGLTRSTEPTCLHGLTGRPPLGAGNAAEHADRCKGGASLDLLDHATIWDREGRPACLLAHCYRPDVSDPERGSWEARVNAYVSAFPGVGVWIGDAAHPLSLYLPGRTVPVLYAAPGIAFRSLANLWAPRGGAADWVIHQRRREESKHEA